MKRKVKRVILLGITYTELILAALAGCAMDSPDLTVPLIVLAQASAWIWLFIKANPEWALGIEKRRKKHESIQRI